MVLPGCSAALSPRNAAAPQPRPYFPTQLMPYSATYLKINLVAMFVVLTALATIPYYITVKLMRYATQATCIHTNNTEDF